MTVSMVVPWGVTICGAGEVAPPPPHPASASAANTRSRGAATVRRTCRLAKIERDFAFLRRETKKSKKNRSNGHWRSGGEGRISGEYGNGSVAAAPLVGTRTMKWAAAPPETGTIEGETWQVAPVGAPEQVMETVPE